MDRRTKERAWNGPRAQCWLVLPGVPGRLNQYPNLSVFGGCWANGPKPGVGVSGWVGPDPAITSCVDETCVLSATVSICGNGATGELRCRALELWEGPAS